MKLCNLVRLVIVVTQLEAVSLSVSSQNGSTLKAAPAAKKATSLADPLKPSKNASRYAASDLFNMTNLVLLASLSSGGYAFWLNQNSTDKERILFTSTVAGFLFVLFLLLVTNTAVYDYSQKQKDVPFPYDFP